MKIFQNNKHRNIEKTITIASIVLMAISVTSAIFSLSRNHSFISDPINYIYYLRYPIIICGGYFIGYMLQDRKHRKPFSFQGATYSLLAVLVFFSLDILRLLIRNIFGTLPYPWEMIMFETMPILAFIITLIIALVFYISEKFKHKNKTFSLLFLSVFAVLQSYMIINPLLLSAPGGNLYDYLIPFVLSLLFSPFLVAAISYISLKNITDKISRMFYSAMIGMFFFTAYLLAWEFSFDPSASAVEVFDYAATALVVAATTAIIMQARK